MSKEAPKEPKFAKEQIMKSANFKERRDLLSVILQDSKKYSIKDVELEIEKALKRKVK